MARAASPAGRGLVRFSLRTRASEDLHAGDEPTPVDDGLAERTDHDVGRLQNSVTAAIFAVLVNRGRGEP